MRNFSAAAVALLACGLPLAANAQFGKLGGEFQVNTYTSGDQENAHVGADANGNFVVVWTSQGADGNGEAAAGQRFSSTGAKLGTEFVANTYTTGDQVVPNVAVQPTGDFVVVWQSTEGGGSPNIFGQRFSSTGASVGTEFQVNTHTTGTQDNPAVGVDMTGDFVVVWEGAGPGDSSGIFGQRYDSTGTTVGTEFRVNTYTTNTQEKPAVALDGAGNFVVVWESFGSDGSLEGVAAQRYDNTGAKLGTEFQVNTFTSGAQEHAAIAMDSTGNFIVAWDSRGQHDGAALEGVFVQRFDNTGTPVGTEFQANTYTTGEQEDPSVALDPAGNFVVVWYSGTCGETNCSPSPGSQDGNGDGAFGQRFSSSGALLGKEFQINTFTSNDQTDPKVVAQPAGNFVVVWQSRGNQDGSGEGVFAQRFGPIGNAAPAVSFPSLAVLALILLLVGGLALGRQRQRRE